MSSLEELIPEACEAVADIQRLIESPESDHLTVDQLRLINSMLLAIRKNLRDVYAMNGKEVPHA